MLSVFLPVLICSSCFNKVPQTGWLTNTDLSSHSSGGQESKMKVLRDGFLLMEGPVPGLSPQCEDDSPCPCVFTSSSLCVCTCCSTQIPLFIRTPVILIRVNTNDLVLI